MNTKQYKKKKKEWKKQLQNLQQAHVDNLKAKKVEQKRIVDEINRELKKVTEKLHRMELELATTANSYVQQFRLVSLRSLISFFSCLIFSFCHMLCFSTFRSSWTSLGVVFCKKKQLVTEQKEIL